MSRPVLQISKFGRSVHDSDRSWALLRKEFDRNHCVRLPAILEPQLLEEIRDRLDCSLFYERRHKGIGLEDCMKSNITLGLLHFLFNDPRLFQIIDRITGCGKIGCCVGRVYRLFPARSHFYSWHSDLAQNRKIAMSINLSRGIFRGGSLQIRNSSSRQILHEVANTGAGDAILFRIAKGLEHQVLPVVGTVTKTAFVGWFRSRPSYRRYFKRSRVRSSPRSDRLPPVTRQDRLRIPPQVVCRLEGEEAVLLYLKTGSLYRLNPVASRLWDLLVQSVPLPEAFHLMAREYDVEPKILERDMFRLIQGLKRERLLAVV